MYSLHARQPKIQMGADTSGLNPSQDHSDFVLALDDEPAPEPQASPSSDPFAAVLQATRPFWSYMQP